MSDILGDNWGILLKTKHHLLSFVIDCSFVTDLLDLLNIFSWVWNWGSQTRLREWQRLFIPSHFVAKTKTKILSIEHQDQLQKSLPWSLQNNFFLKPVCTKGNHSLRLKCLCPKPYRWWNNESDHLAKNSNGSLIILPMVIPMTQSLWGAP